MLFFIVYIITLNIRHNKVIPCFLITWTGSTNRIGHMNPLDCTDWELYTCAMWAYGLRPI